MTEHQPIPWRPLEKGFAPLKLQVKQPAVPEVVQYRVFRSAEEYKDVEALTVTDAIAKSGITEPMLLVRLDILRSNVYQPGELREASAGAPQKAE